MNKSCFAALLAGLCINNWAAAATPDESSSENKDSQCRDALLGAGFSLGLADMGYYIPLDTVKTEPPPLPALDIYSEIPAGEKIEIKLNPESQSRCETCSQESLAQVAAMASDSYSVVFVNVDSNLPIQEAMRIMESLMRVVRPNGPLVFVREGHVLPKVINAASYLNYKSEPVRIAGELHIQTILKSAVR